MIKVIAHHHENGDFTKRVETVILETQCAMHAHRCAAMNTSSEIDHELDAIANGQPFVRAIFEVRDDSFSR